MNSEYEPYWSNYLTQFDLSAEHFQNIPEVTDKYCVIVEPRSMEILPKVIKNFMYLLQHKGWGLIVAHGTENETFIKNHLNGWPNVKFYNLGEKNLTIDMYNMMFCTPKFWSDLLSMKCKHALIFQNDTLLLKDNIDDFLEYDYVGAPWFVKFYGILEVGNGGLSLRNVQKMIDITSQCPRYIPSEKGGTMYLDHEDIYFAFWCLMKNYKIPTPKKAKEFSVETVYYNDTCGLHKPLLKEFPSKQHYINLLNKKHVIN
jgi:hypothetical protein